MKIIKYEVAQQIGTGNFSKVYRAINQETNQPFALKVMSSHRSIARKEAELLRKTDHPNIVSCYNYVEEKEGYRLFLEYLPTNILTLYQESVCGLKEDQVKCILFQVALALVHIHRKGIVHRDIKPENILIDRSKAIIKIIDFGLAISERQMRTDYIATRWYRSPQNLLCTKQYTTAIDIFSLGCVIVQLYLGDPLFPGIDNLDQISKIFHLLGQPTKQTWSKGFQKLQEFGISLPEDIINQSKDKPTLRSLMKNCHSKLVDLIEKMLILNPKDRISAQALIRHQYFKDVQQIIPPIVYQRYKKDFPEQGEIIALQDSQSSGTTQRVSHNKDLVKTQRNNERNRFSNLGRSAHDATEFLNTLKFRQSTNMKMNSKLSLREFKVRDQQVIGNRSLGPAPFINRHQPSFLIRNYERGICRADVSSEIYPVTPTLHQNGGLEAMYTHIYQKNFRDMGEERRDNMTSLQKRPSYTEIGYKGINLGSSSPPKMINNNNLERSVQVPLKAIESETNIRKVSDHDIQKKQKKLPFGNPPSNRKGSEDFIYINNLTLVESRHHKTFDPLQQRTDKKLLTNKQIGQPKELYLRSQQNRISPSFRQLSLTKDSSPNYHINNLNQKGSHNNVPQFLVAKKFESRSKGVIENCRSQSQINCNRRKSGQIPQTKVSTPSNYSHIKAFINNRKELKQPDQVKQELKIMKTVYDRSELKQTQLGRQWPINVPIIHSVEIPMSAVHEQSISLKSPSNAATSSTAYHKNQLIMKQSSGINNHYFQHRKPKDEAKTNGQQRSFRPSDCSKSSSIRPANQAQGGNLNSYIHSTTNFQSSNQQYPIIGHKIKNGQLTLDSRRQIGYKGPVNICISPQNVVSQGRQLNSFTISSPVSKGSFEKNMNLHVLKTYQSQTGNLMNPYNPQLVQKNPGLILSNNTSPRGPNNTLGMVSPRVFKPKPT